MSVLVDDAMIGEAPEERVSPEDALTILEAHAHGILTRSHREVVSHVRRHASGERRIPRSDRPHMHPERARIPCLVCAVAAAEIDAVSGSVLLTLLDRRNHDEFWNCEEHLTLSDVVSAAERARPTPITLMRIFGDYWPVVLCLAYRVQVARGRELTSLLAAAVSYPDHLPKDRDTTISSRWLVSQALTHQPSATIGVRDRRREALKPLQNMATAVHLNGYPAAEGDKLYDWLDNVVPSLLPRKPASPW